MQATQLTDQPKAKSDARALPGNAPGTPFVINLCSSTSPVALSPPDHAGLKRFTFFVSRRREESRERFRLHMGYFQTQEEAERLLDIVREIYPGAWAGLAPGQRQRAAAAAVTEPPPLTLTVPKITVPDPIAPAAVAAAMALPLPAVSVPLPPEQAMQQPVSAVLELMPDAGRRMSEAEPEASENDAAAQSLSNVRAAIASLDDTAARPMPRIIPELKAAVHVPKAKPLPVAPAQELNDEAAMAVLEGGAKLPPMPTAGRDAAKEAAVPAGEKAVFAVQLMWSVQPIDIAQMPQLAIFSAYTLYGAEGNRDGRRWYGLRLGFFTDAVSAKQVAHYVRSEFSTVSVVPVTTREKERAMLASARPADAKPATSAQATAPTGVVLVQSTAAPKPDQFQFIEDKPLPAAGSGSKAAARAAPAPRTARVAPGKRAKLRNPAQAAAARARPKKLTLEETLEILGAGDLKMDDGNGEVINDDAAANGASVRPQPAKAKPSRLGRLFERLSERIGS